MSKRTALVTGATGFIGHHLCRRLMDQGIHVVGTSRQAQSVDYVHSMEQCDLGDTKQVDTLFEQVAPDYLFHLASHVKGAREIDLVMPTFEDNLLSTVNLLTAAHHNDCKKVVLTGSLEEPQPDNNWSIPSSPYAASKLAANAYGRMYHSLYDLPIAILRLFMVYGPEQRDEKKLIPYTILSLHNGEIPQFSGGGRLVDWVYVDDVVDAYIACIESDKADGQVIDIGSGELVSVKAVVTQIAEHMKATENIEFGAISERKNEQVRSANLASAASILNWQPKTSLNEGLKKTIESYIS